jgi:hypothetical protein
MCTVRDLGAQPDDGLFIDACGVPRLFSALRVKPCVTTGFTTAMTCPVSSMTRAQFSLVSVYVATCTGKYDCTNRGGWAKFTR